MKRAFVVTLNLDSSDSDADSSEAANISDALEDAGYNVVSVNPFGGDAPTHQGSSSLVEVDPLKGFHDPTPLPVTPPTSGDWL